jgi:phosphomevalonate kinase
MAASAPGKIILLGEYVVLDGERAVVLAVDRRARASLQPSPRPPSVFLRAAIEEVARAFGSRSAEADAIARVVVDTSRLSEDGHKLGLGSSAAATVSAIACSLQAGVATEMGTREKAQVLLIASAAHAAAQKTLGGIAGSGADVYAAVTGGVRAYRQAEGRPSADALSLPPGFSWLGVWTRTPADTRELVAAVQSYRDDAPAGYDIHARAISEACRSFIDACTVSSADAVDAIDRGARAIAALGEAAGVELETEAHRRIAEIARRAGGAAKPTGSGGGDIAVAAFADPSQASRFRDDLRGVGIEALDLSVDTDGVRLHP